MSAPELIRSPRPPADLLLRDVRVLDPRLDLDGRHDVLVRAGRVAALGAPGTLAEDAVNAGVEVLEGGGRLALLPAFFDPHVHLRSPGQEHKEDIESGTRAAAAGGFAGVIAMPNTDPAIDSVDGLRAVRETAARQAHVPVGFLPAITRDLAGEELTDMAALRELGALGFTDDGHPVADAGVLRAALRLQVGGASIGAARAGEARDGSDRAPRVERGGVGGVLTLHEEDRALSRGGSMHEGAVSAELGIPGVPAASEATMVARDAALAACEGGRVHFQHLSCESSVHAVAAAKQRGFKVSAEVSPHHLLLTDEHVRTLDTRMKMNPPLATEADREALVEGLRAGTIDCVATDHAPHAPAEKALAFTRAPMGTTGLETAFAALYTELVLPGVFSLGLLVERMTAGAALFELSTPRIARDEEANLTLVDLDADWTAGEGGWQSRSQNCCFAGRRLRGRVLMTLAAGSIVYRAGTDDAAAETEPAERARPTPAAETEPTAAGSQRAARAQPATGAQPAVSA
jgi:dihydroorotase